MSLSLVFLLCSSKFKSATVCTTNNAGANFVFFTRAALHWKARSQYISKIGGVFSGTQT